MTHALALHSHAANRLARFNRLANAIATIGVVGDDTVDHAQQRADLTLKNRDRLSQWINGSVYHGLKLGAHLRAKLNQRCGYYVDLVITEQRWFVAIAVVVERWLSAGVFFVNDGRQSGLRHLHDPLVIFHWIAFDQSLKLVDVSMMVQDANLLAKCSFCSNSATASCADSFRFCSTIKVFAFESSSYTTPSSRCKVSLTFFCA